MFTREQNEEYIKWRRKVLVRDGRCCKWFGCTRKNRLNVHHIHRWADSPFLRYQVSNGITLCSIHHKMVTGHEEEFAPTLISLISRKNA